MRSLALWQAVFVFGMLLAGSFEVAGAYGWVGFRGVEGVVYSDLLCLIPGCITIQIVGLTRRSGWAPYAVLVGIGLRMVCVVSGLLAIKAVRQDLGFNEFVVWLIVNYLVALALETWVVVRLCREAEISG